MIVLHCASMAHVIDRAVGFRFLGSPYHCIAVSPNGVTLHRDRDHRYAGPDTVRIEVKP